MKKTRIIIITLIAIVGLGYWTTNKFQITDEAQLNTEQENQSSDTIYTTEHFKIFYTGLDQHNIKDIADSLEHNYPRIIESLQSEPLPMVNIHFYTSVSSLQEGVKSIEPNLPSFAIGLATSVSEIHMISPNHPNQDYQTMIRNTIHEFAHCVSLNINENIANNPRWLWEVVAIYQAKQTYNPHQLQYLVNQEPPALDELNKFTNTYIYEVGYFIAEYIVASKGEAALHELIKNNGDIEATLGLNDTEFTEQWFTHVKREYGI